MIDPHFDYILLGSVEYCQLLRSKSHQYATLNMPYNLTFTFKFNGFSCDDLCMKPAIYCFLHNNTVADDHHNTYISNGRSCTTAFSQCCIYNITLRIQNMTSNDVGKYDFRFAGHACGCTWYKEAFVDLQGMSI